MTTRRFELVEGKSAKFWEVEVEGMDLHLRWGRLGTNGQAQTKSFDSDASAQREVEKLVKEKTKKGYGEVAAGEESPRREVVTAPPVPPEPSAPPEPSMSSEPGAALGEARVRPGISAPEWEMPPEPRAELWKSFCSGMASMRKEMKIAPAHAPAPDAARTERMLELLGTKVAPELDVDTAAQLIGIANESAHDFVRASLGDLDLLRAVIASGGYTMAGASAGNTSKYYYFVRATYDDAHQSKIGAFCAAGAIADALAANDFAMLSSEVEGAWSGWPLEQQARVALLMGRDPRWARMVLDATGEHPQSSIAIVAALRSTDEVKRLLKGMSPSFLYPPPEMLMLLLARRGADAGAMFVVLYEGLRELRSLVDAMQHLETLEVARVFADLLEHREHKGRARAYLEATPALAIVALSGSRKQMARSVLEAIVRAHPALVDALLPGLAPSERTVIDAIREASAVDVADAGAASLPRVLVDPPWTRKAQKAQSKPVTLELEPIAMPESVEWRPGQRAEWLALASWGTPSAKGSASAQKELELALTDKSHGVYLYRLLMAEDAALEALWNRITAEVLAWAPAESARKLVARLEERGIPGYLEYARKNAVSAAEVLVRVRSARLAPFYARTLASRGKARGAAQAWLEAFPEHAAAGLVPIALGSAKKERAQAEDALSYLGQKGHAEAVRAVAARYGKDAIAPVEELLARDPLAQVPAKLPKLPEWARADALPRPLLVGRASALPPAAVEHLLTMLSFSPLDPAYPGIEHVRDACDPQSLADFSWALFSAWLGADGSSAGDWAMLSLAHFGGDEAARRLTPSIRKWPGEGGHARAVKGLDVLATIGTDVALMHLHGISQKLKFKGLQAKAQEKIAQIAEARELTAEELADRLVPDLDLDARGTLLLDFGPRQFTVGFDEQLTPFVLESGTRKKDLPKPGKSDDAEKAKEAIETWRALKKDVRAIASHQITRLEQLMCSGRRVSHDVFRKFFVDHPLVTHLVQRLVWGAFVDGALTTLFRVDGERRATSATDEPIEIPEGAEIGIVHPLLMDAGANARFGELFADYEILQPFEQLGRGTFTATPEELAAKALKRFEGAKAPLGKVRGLESQGWVRGMPQDAGLVWDVTKPVSGGLEIVVGLEPGFSAAGYNDFADTATQTITAPAVRRAGQWNADVGLDVLDAVQMSELIRDVTLLTS